MSRIVNYLSACAVVALSFCTAHAAGCYNIARGEPRELTGRLQFVIFAGPPGYRDVRRGDAPEPGYVLDLDRPICITGDEYADPAKAFRSVQIVEMRSTAASLRALQNKYVTVTLTQHTPEQTGHHHRPLVAWAAAVRPVAARPMDFMDEMGTAATTIRTFYSALGYGQGATASAMVVPEKRASAAYSPAGLSQFYGGLAQPIRLLDISQSGPSAYLVHYRYATRSRVCDGRAIVTTALRGGNNLIQSIKALDGC
jgi:hypothetical protein